MQWIDISHVIDENTPLYPGDHDTMLTLYKEPERDHFTSYLLTSCLHTGTHIDAPMHLVEDGRFIREFPVDCFAGRGVLLDVRGEREIAMRPAYRNIVPPGSVVLLYTGMDATYHEPSYFSAHPVVGEELGAFLLSRDIKVLGMDMPAPDHPPYAFHKELLRRGIFVLENLTNLGALTAVSRFEVMAFPLKLTAEASLVRAVCRVDA